MTNEKTGDILVVRIIIIGKVPMLKEIEILNEFLARKNLRPSSQRKTILREFLSIERHITAEELYVILKKKNPGIGSATVHRSLRLFTRCGLAGEARLGDKRTYYEHTYKHEHHDHLICIRCGRTFEFLEARIEKLQRDIAKKFDFKVENHTLELYGVCARCK